MNPIKTVESNFVFLGPSIDVADLPCRREGSGTFSVWQFTDEERAMIAAGGNVRLGIYGMSRIPPVSLQVVANDGPWARVPSPCSYCGKEADDPVHGSGAATHAFRLQEIPFVAFDHSRPAMKMPPNERKP